MVPNYAVQQEYRDLDQLINYADTVVKVLSLASNTQAPGTLEFITLQVSASAFSIVFSIRELVKLGYFPSVRILLRSLLDRTATIAWIRFNSKNGIKVWQDGWLYRERPEKLPEKLKCLYKFKIFLDDDRPLEQYLNDEHFIEDFHGDVHGDLKSAMRNRVIGDDGQEYLVAGPNTLDISQFRATCKLASAICGQFLKEMDVSMTNVIPAKKST